VEDCNVTSRSVAVVSSDVLSIFRFDHVSALHVHDSAFDLLRRLRDSHFASVLLRCREVFVGEFCSSGCNVIISCLYYSQIKPLNHYRLSRRTATRSQTRPVCNKGITQFYLPPIYTRTIVLSVLPGRKATAL